MNPYVAKGLTGLALGAVLSGVGFTNHDELVRMLTFADLRLFLVFGGAVVVAMVGIELLKSRGTVRVKPIHKGSVVGGVLFGAGWALSGVCPAVPLAQLGEGQLLGLVSMLGIVSGMSIYRLVNGRYLRWSTGSCT